MTILNVTHISTVVKEGQCVARGISSEQSSTEAPVTSLTLTEGETLRLNDLLDEYNKCFTANNSELGNTTVEMKIKLTSMVPVCYRPYRLSYHEREIVRNIVTDLLQNDIIEPTVSEYASPILLVDRVIYDDECELLKRQIQEGTADKSYTLVDEKVCKVINNEIKLLIPKDIRWGLVKLYHDDNGHPGPKRTLDAITKKYWFSKIKQFVAKYVNACIPCLCAKVPTRRRRGHLYPIKKIDRPFHTLHLDHLGPFCKSPNGNSYLLVVVEAFTKFTWLEAVKDTSTRPVIDCLRLLMKFCGHPTRIITDRGKGFTSEDMNEFCNSENIKNVLNAIASPRSNGQVERFNRTILNSLTAAIGDDHSSWESKIPEVQSVINSCLNSSTGKSPSELLYRFRPRLKYDIDLLNITSDTDRQEKLKTNRTLALGNLTKTAISMQKHYNKNRLPAIKFKEGDMVLVKRSPLIRGVKQRKVGPEIHWFGPSNGCVTK
ncbi:hypothetical protein NQ317_001873 [Molorchus minor]|uniref:RNA-directed DNA polymerase n=1 Tax=Molorchus minor TaxID=1323400 RepID=A0ABQ9J5E5_9CUCU|nr:hypothetical protein NQ317_001873 [Molorchus minor]